jgi:phage terminase large subunit-like protein
MKRKTAQELEQAGNRAAARRRRAQEATEGPGVPLRPPGLPRAARNAWNKLVEELRPVLLKSDGALLRELIQARADLYHAAGDRKEAARLRVKEIEAEFSRRKPALLIQDKQELLIEEKADHISLADFLAATARARATFAARLVPKQTLMLDEGGLFDWSPADPSSRARDYAQRVAQGTIPACDLHKRSCARFLDDLEHGAEKGFFYDVLQARQIATWFAVFLNRPAFDWQLFVLVNLFGFRRPSGLRRFLECWTWVARQNGKSSLNAGIGLFLEMCDGEEQSQVYSAATTLEQASIIFKDAKRLVKMNPELKQYVTSYRSSLAIEDSDSTFQPLASEVASLDGLRPAALLADEIHEWDAAAAGREQWAKLTSGMVSRRHPLTMAISTAGGAQRGFGWEKFEMVKKILQRVIVAEDVFCCVWELEPQDDYRDTSLWIKANPSLGQGLTLESLQRQFRETEADPSSLSSFLRYQCNRWTELRRNNSTFLFSKVDACRGYPDFPHATPRELYAHFLEHNAGKPSFGGFDYGEVSDLCAFSLLYPKAVLASGEVLSVKVLISEFWMPSANVAQRQKDWGVPVEQWVRDGWIKTCDGDMNDPRQLKKDLLEIIAAKQEPSGFPVFNIRSIGYDKWHSRPFMAAFSEDTSIECVEVSQMPSVLTPLAVAFKTAVLSGQLWHLDNPVVKWMLGNVILERSGKYDAIVPEKPNKHQKIDCVQAALCGWERMETAPAESVYNYRGIITLDNDFTKAVYQSPKEKK